MLHIATAPPKKQAAFFEAACCAFVRDVEGKGDVKEDVRGRPLYHLRKPPFEFYPENINRHGCYIAELEDFIRKTAPRLPAPEPTLFEPKPAPREGPELTSADAAAAIEAEAGRLGSARSLRALSVSASVA